MRIARYSLLALLTLVLAFFLIHSPSPPRRDLDAAWSMTLLFAHRHGLQFGRDIVFTYGPLGYLISNVYYDGVPLIRFIWEVFGKLAFAVTLMAIAYSFGWVRLLWFYALVIFATLISPELFTSYGVPLLALCWLLPNDAKLWHQIVALFWLALFSNMRFNSCTMAFAALGVLCARGFLHKQWRLPLLLVSSFAFAFVGLWLAAGQRIKNIPRYFFNGWQISNGYLDAMFTDELPSIIWWMGALLWLIILAFCLRIFARPTDPRQRWNCLYLFIGWFFLWKHGFTRADHGHIMLFFPAAAVFFAAAPGGMGEGRRWTLLDSGAIVCVIGLFVYRPEYLPFEPPTQILQPEKYLKQFARGEQEDEARHGKPNLRSLVGNQTIDVINCDQDEVLREHLNFHPRPIFQSYSAYTPSLLRTNLHFYERKKAPSFIFARLQAVDDRYPAQEDSLLLEELPRRYRLLTKSGDYALLYRRQDQPNEPLRRESVLQREVLLGDEIAVPASDCAVELRAVFRRTIYGRMRSVFIQPSKIRIVLTDQQGHEHTGRVIPEIARAGFLIQPLLEKQQDLEQFIDGQWTGRIRSIRFVAEAGTEDRWSKISVEISRLPDLGISTRAAYASP